MDSFMNFAYVTKVNIKRNPRYPHLSVHNHPIEIQVSIN